MAGDRCWSGSTSYEKKITTLNQRVSLTLSSSGNIIVVTFFLKLAVWFSECSKKTKHFQVITFNLQVTSHLTHNCGQCLTYKITPLKRWSEVKCNEVNDVKWKWKWKWIWKFVAVIWDNHSLTRNHWQILLCWHSWQSCENWTYKWED